MSRDAVRIPLDVPQEMAADIDRGVYLLGLATGKRETRTSFIKKAIQDEVKRLDAIHPNVPKKPKSVP